jgi:hypothetical protein
MATQTGSILGKFVEDYEKSIKPALASGNFKAALPHISRMWVDHVNFGKDLMGQVPAYVYRAYLDAVDCLEPFLDRSMDEGRKYFADSDCRRVFLDTIDDSIALIDLVMLGKGNAEYAEHRQRFASRLFMH